MPWANEQESRKHPVLFDTNSDKMAAVIKDLYGQFLRHRVHFLCHSEICEKHFVKVLQRCRQKFLSGPTMYTDNHSNLSTGHFTYLGSPGANKSPKKYQY